MNKLKLKVALIAIATAFLAGQAAAQSMVDISVCNRTGAEAMVAISYQPVSAKPTDWKNQGWFTVYSGDCAFIASTATANFYVYAEGPAIRRYSGAATITFASSTPALLISGTGAATASAVTMRCRS